MAAKISMDMPGGLKMPALGLGTWQASNEAELENALNYALEIGYRHIDTATAYGNEHVIGRVLKQWFSSKKLKREDIFLVTKLPIWAIDENKVEEFLKLSLKHFELDYVDLYLIHFPIGQNLVDGKVVGKPYKSDHIAIWKEMEKQVDAGRAKTIGVSNFNSKQIEKISKSARIKPACLQVELHIYLQQRELVDYCHKNGIVVVAYSPLGCPGYNKFLEAFNKEPKNLPDMLHDEVVKKIAAKHKKSNAQILLRYLLQKNIVPIPKSVTPARLKENIDVFDFSLDAEDMKSLDGKEVGEQARVCDFQIFPELPEHPEWPFPK